jgi:hypothetical protein
VQITTPVESSQLPFPEQLFAPQATSATQLAPSWWYPAAHPSQLSPA